MSADDICSDCYTGHGPATACHRPEHWCRFTTGTTQCINGARCRNPNHVEDRDPWNMPNNVKIDRFGRYMLINPLTGEEQPFTRATTIAKTTDDTYHLEQWGHRMVAYGMGQRPDLVALAAAADGPDDKRILGDVVEQAKHAASSARKANIGTALHGLTHKIDRGDADVHVPAEYRDHITRYKTLVSLFGFRWITKFIEVTLLLPDLLIAGSADRLADWHRSPVPIVADLKTGGTLDFSKVSIAQQLAIYSRGTHWWDGKAPVEMPPVNQNEALVIHLPGTTDEEPKVYLVDINEGWKLVQQSLDVRGVRKTKGKHLFTEIKPDATPTPAADREGDLRARVKAIVAAGHTAALKGLWRPDVPTLKEGGLSPEHLDLVASWCAQVEKEKGL